MIAAARTLRQGNGFRRVKQRLFQVLGFARVRGAARSADGMRAVAPHSVLYKLHGGVAFLLGILNHRASRCRARKNVHSPY
jgi:hypothetical protein